MRLPVKRLAVSGGSLALAFAAGLFAAHLAPHAEAQTGPAPLTPRIVNVLTMPDEEIGPLNGDQRSRNLVTTRDGTINVQSGNVFKHFHADADEIQLILDGTGTFWLGEREVEIKPGDLIVIPRGTHHAGSRPSTGRFRALAIKLPPQRADDTVRVP